MRRDTPLRGVLSGALTLTACALFALFLNWAPTGLNGYQLRILNLIAINGILGLSLNLIYGMTGMFSLGHAGFMAVGAYIASILTVNVFPQGALVFLFPVAILAGGLGAAFVGHA